ncbi:MAG: hypothetical protein HYY84_04830 [Deltaproteobacteria bacterium]|nr:hypothetical protein [Deltaproteobacteria bacterium]
MGGQPTQIADALLIDVFASRAIAGGFSAFLNAGNLLNVRYETFQGRPMFPRTLLAGLEMKTP